MRTTTVVEIHSVAPLAGKTTLPQLVATGPKAALAAMLQSIDADLASTGDFGAFLFREDRDLFLSPDCPDTLSVALNNWLAAHRTSFSRWTEDQLSDDDAAQMSSVAARLETITDSIRKDLRPGVSHAEIRERIDELNHFSAQFSSQLAALQSCERHPAGAISHYPPGTGADEIMSQHLQDGGSPCS